MKHLVKFNEDLDPEIEISFGGKGKAYFQHETSISYNFNGTEYWFTMIEKGDMDDAPKGTAVEFISDDELPFELTEDMKTQMYSLAWENN